MESKQYSAPRQQTGRTYDTDAALRHVANRSTFLCLACHSFVLEGAMFIILHHGIGKEASPR